MSVVREDYKDIDEKQCDLAEPNAAPMIESLRAFGYELPSAIADLIDNSIYAKAKNVWIDFFWNGEDSTICVTDDGKGMTKAELIAAMRPGSCNPLESRDSKDLGRYGLGLKTASFSQCRKLTVRSKTAGGAAATRCWDLDFVASRNKWLLLRDAGKTCEKHLERFKKLVSGTAVLWDNMDRIVKGQSMDEENYKSFFLNRIGGVEKHLAMVFHRFLEGKGRLKLFIQNNPIESWDPFLKSEKATQLLADEKITLFNQQIRVIPYVLPHNSKLTPEKHVKAAGIKGWNLHQGFYVYRNERLLVPGHWLGLPFAKEEHFKLARIQLDIPNSMDHEWEIDVTKSKARPPDALRKELKRIADITRKRASEIYRYRGKVVARTHAQEFVFVWEQKIKHGKYFYRINRQHPLVKKTLTAEPRLVEKLLRMVEETFPVSFLTITNSEQPDMHADSFEGVSAKEILSLMTEIYQVMVDSKMKPDTAIERLRVMEPFYRFPELVETFSEKTMRVEA